MELIKLSVQLPTERNLSINEFIEDINNNNSFYGVIDYDIKIGGTTKITKGILSNFFEKNNENKFVVTWISHKNGSNTNFIDNEQLIKDLEVYRFKDKEELLDWLKIEING